LAEYERADAELKEFALLSTSMQANEEKFQLENMKDLIAKKLLKEVLNLNTGSV